MEEQSIKKGLWDKIIESEFYWVLSLLILLPLCFLNIYNTTIFPNIDAGRTLFVCVIIFCILFLGTLYFSKELKVEHILFSLFIVAVIVRVVYLYDTDVYIRQHDTSGAFGHIDYIKYIADTLSLPKTDQWQFYQPPLHYALCSIFWNIGSFFKMGEMWTLALIETFMVFLSSLEVFLVYKLLKLLKFKGWQLICGFMLFAFHPTNILMSRFFNNDTTMTFFYILAFYLVMYWYNNRKVLPLALAGLALGLAVWSKVNAVMLFFVLLIGCFYILIKEREKKARIQNIRHISVFAGISLVICAALPILNYIRFHVFLIPVPTVQDELLVPNTFKNLFFVSPSNLIFTTYTNVIARNSLIEYLFKSSLFGEFYYNNLNGIATILVWLALLIGILIIIHLIVKHKKMLDFNNFIMLVFFFVPVIFEIYFRIQKPYWCSENFRYIAMIILPVAYFISQATSVEDKEAPTYLQKNCAVLLRLLTIAFCLASVWFYTNA